MEGRVWVGVHVGVDEGVHLGMGGGVGSAHQLLVKSWRHELLTAWRRESRVRVRLTQCWVGDGPLLWRGSPLRTLV